MKVLTKENKEKENILINLELINLKNVFLLQFEEFKRKTLEVEKKQFMEDKKEYHKTLRHLQAQLERAKEQNKSLDLIGIKKRLEDYEQVLKYYTLMRTKNKMKVFEVESKEQWEVIEEYFTKELEKNLVQHKVNERILRYKLEIYQKNFLDFICRNPTSIEVLGQDEEIKVGPSGTTQEEEVQIKESQDLISGVVQEEVS